MRPLASARYIDATSVYCDTGNCHPTVGRITTFFDDIHLGATLTRTMTPLLPTHHSRASSAPTGRLPPCRSLPTRPRPRSARYLALVATGTADEIADLYASDAVLEDPVGSPPLQGRDAIRAFYATVEPLGDHHRAGDAAFVRAARRRSTSGSTPTPARASRRWSRSRSWSSTTTAASPACAPGGTTPT